MLSFLRLIVILFLFASLNAQADAKVIALPDIANKTLTPRVIYIENPRFPKLTQSELKKVLISAQLLVRNHFDFEMQLPERIPVQDIRQIFKKLVANEPPQFKNLIGDFRNNRVDWELVRENLLKDIELQDAPLSTQIAFVTPYLTRPIQKPDLASFSRAVVETFENRLSHWTRAMLEDGYPVIGAAPDIPDLPYNEYGYWSLMAKLGIEAEIVLTNQLVASVEYMQLPIHTSIRGGITGGSTEYNPASRYGSSVWISLFPYLSDDETIRELRNGDSYSREQALSFAGAMVAHEIGHQLLHLGHPWANPACIMRPAEVLDFASWTERFDPARCKLSSSPEMKPGSLKIPVW